MARRIRYFLALVTLLASPGLAESRSRQRPTPPAAVDRTFSMCRGGVLGGIQRLGRRLNGQPATIQVRVHSPDGVSPPDRTLQALAVAAGRMHERRAYPIGNLCRRVAVDLAGQIDRKRIGTEHATLLYNDRLSETARGLMPEDWHKPIGYANHWITYCKIGELHYAVDGTAQDYLNDDFTPQGLRGQGRIDAEIFVASTAGELQTSLAQYYGGLPGRWARHRPIDLEKIPAASSRSAAGARTGIPSRTSERSKAIYREAFAPIPFP